MCADKWSDGSLQSADRFTKRPQGANSIMSRLQSQSENFSLRASTVHQGPLHTRRCPGWLPRFPVFDPQETAWLDRWDFLVMVMLLEVTFFTPFELAFLEVKLNWIFFMNRVIDLIFWIDVGLKFLIAIPDPHKRGCIIKDHGKIAYTYLTSWLFPDVVGLLPVDILIYAEQAKGRTKDLKVLRLARTVRLIRATQGLRLLHRWRTTMGLRNWLISIIGLLYSLSVTLHWAACLWAGVGRSLWEEDEPNWIASLMNYKKGAPEWYTEPEYVYFLALYWAMFTMFGIGYGDITPINSLEIKLCCGCMALMAGFYAVVIGEVISIFSSFSEHENNFKRTMDDLNWLLGDWNVHPEVRRRLRTYFMESKHVTRALMQKQILERMSPKLQGEVLNSAHRPWTAKLRCLREISDEGLVQVVRRLDTMLFAPDELIYNDRTLFVVRRGVAVLLGKIMVSGTAWGEDMVLHNGFLRKRSSARALCYLDVNALKYADLMQVAVHHPALERRIIACAKLLALHRSIVHVGKVIKSLRFHSLVDELSPGVLCRLAEAALTGTIDVDTLDDPVQRSRVAGFVDEVLREDDPAYNSENDGSSGEVSSPRSPGGREPRSPTSPRNPRRNRTWSMSYAVAHPASIINMKPAIEELMGAYNSRLADLLRIQGTVRSPTSGSRSPTGLLFGRSYTSGGRSPPRSPTMRNPRQKPTLT